MVLETLQEKSEHISHLLYEAPLSQLSQLLLNNQISLTKFSIKKFNLKLRNLVLNFHWSFNSLVLLSYPIINGANQYTFLSKLEHLSAEEQFQQGIHYLIGFQPFSRFLKEFFGLSQMELEMVRQLVLISKCHVSFKGKSGNSVKDLVLKYDVFLTILRFVFLTPEGIFFMIFIAIIYHYDHVKFSFFIIQIFIFKYFFNVTLNNNSKKI